MPEPTTAGEVMRRCLLHWNIWKDQVIPRCCLTGWEADLLIIKPSGWAEEVEIKVTAGDFRSEWKKKAEKHRQFQGGKLRRVAYCTRAGEYVSGGGWPVPYVRNPGVEYEEDRYGLYIRDEPTLIRRFWFAMPASLAEKLLPEVPEPYGVLAVGHHNQVLRSPTNLQSARKLTDAERIRALHSAYSRFWRLTLDAEALEALAIPSGEESNDHAA